MKKTIVITDIDGTLAEYKFRGKEDLEKPLTMVDKLKNLVPFDWVKKSGFFVKENDVYFVSGRRQEHENLTVDWIRKHLGLDPVLVRLVGFQNRRQYIEDKITEIFDIIKLNVDKFGDDLKVIIVEDDVDVLQAVLRENKKFGVDLQIYQVEGNTLFAR